MRNLIDLYTLILNRVILYKNNKIKITHNGLCILTNILYNNLNLITYEEYMLLDKDLDNRIKILPNYLKNDLYKWIPMGQSKEGIQPRIDFILSIINELKDEENTK